jgi:hypothetical protein
MVQSSLCEKTNMAADGWAPLQLSALQPLELALPRILQVVSVVVILLVSHRAWTRASSRPAPAAAKGPAPSFQRFLLARCAALRSPYSPSLWFRSGLLQTVLAQTAHKVQPGLMPKMVRQLIPVVSGGTVSLSWFGDEEAHSEPNIVVVGLPGAGSCFPDHGLIPTLLCHLYHRLGRPSDGGTRGPRVSCAVATYQGLAGLPLDSPKLPGSAYCSTDDMAALIAAARDRHPSAVIVVVAASFGTALFTNWVSPPHRYYRHTCPYLHLPNHPYLEPRYSPFLPHLFTKSRNSLTVACIRLGEPSRAACLPARCRALIRRPLRY